MKYFKFFCLIITISIFSFIDLNAQNYDEKDLLKTFHSISSHDIYDYVVELTSKKYNGRLSGTPEYMNCAKWIADSLQAWGIKPYGDNGTYFQNFDKFYVDVKNPGSLTINIPDKNGKTAKKTYSSPKDFYAGSNSGSGKVQSEAIYAGYGITAPELGYDDYDGIDVKGKIVVLETGLPYSKQDSAMIKWVPYSYSQYKFENAIKHGAIGLLYIGKTANPNTPYNKGFIYCLISDLIVNDLFLNTEINYQDHKNKINENLRPSSFNTRKKVTITANTVYHPEGKSCNVVGVIEGTDPILKDEVIIVGGHLDGQGNLGFLFPSALDNASGIADMLGAAKALSKSKIKLKRSIMFLFIGGEEGGLLGSYLYCAQPKVPKEKTICFFNLDMVGNGMGFSIGGGLSYPLIYKHFEDANNKYLHRTIRSSKTGRSLGRPRSDGAIFSREGFRSLSIGTSDATKAVYYHDERDTKEMLTPEIMEDVAKLIFIAFTNMANADKLFE